MTSQNNFDETLLERLERLIRNREPNTPAARLHLLQEWLGYSNSQMGELIGVGPGHLSNIYSGAKSLSLKAADRLHDFGGFSLDWLFYGEGTFLIGRPNQNAYLNAYPNAHLKDENKTKRKNFEGVEEVRVGYAAGAFDKKKRKTFPPNAKLPAVAVVDASNNPLIPVLSHIAAAGLPSNYQDAGWYEQLPAMSLPFPDLRMQQYICLQVAGSSMEACIHHMDYIICAQCLTPNQLRRGHVYLLVLFDGLAVKRCEQPESLLFISDNPTYGPLQPQPDEVLQLWEVRYILSGQLSPHLPHNPDTEAIMQRLRRLEHNPNSNIEDD